MIAGGCILTDMAAFLEKAAQEPRNASENQCITMRYFILYNTLQYCSILYSIVLIVYNKIFCQHCIVLQLRYCNYGIVQKYCIILQLIVLHCILYPLYIVSYCNHCILYYIVYCLILFSLSIVFYCILFDIVLYCPLYHIVHCIILYLIVYCIPLFIVVYCQYCILYLIVYCIILYYI